MVKTILFFLCIAIACLCFSCKEHKTIDWVVSTPDHSWISQESQQIKILKEGFISAEVNLTNTEQTIDGFGACFNELGWTSLSVLPEKDREDILKELFYPGQGTNFTICRMPVGANDFSRNWYSYNETEGDFEMKNFSIANDFETLIPFIRLAKKYNPSLTLWASPWSPPAWMKYNKHYACNMSGNENFPNGLLPSQRGREGTNMFIQDKKYFEAYALYFAKFIEAYKNEGIYISMVMPQNEFNSCQIFPSCTWTASGINTFVGEHLGPQMEKTGTDVMFGTMERANTLLVDTLLQDEKSSKYIKGIGFQWAGKDAVGKIHKDYPLLKIYQTEQECGDGKNNWDYCCYAWELMKHYLSNGANVYCYWNISLEEGGVSRWGWSQNSLITVDVQAKAYTYNYEYYLMKHFSHYVLPGAQRLSVTGEFNDLLAFRNVDGSLVLVIHNRNNNEVFPNIKIGEDIYSLTLKPQSFHTLVIGK